MSHTPMPDQGQSQAQQGHGQAIVQGQMNNAPHPQPTPAMRQLQIEMQRLQQQYQQLGGNNHGNLAQVQPIVARMQQLKTQYGQLGQQQMAQFRAQQQQLQQQQQNQHAQQQAMSQQQQQAMQMRQNQAQAAAAAAATAAAAASSGAQGSPATNNQHLRPNTGAPMANRPAQVAAGPMGTQAEMLFGKAPPANASPQVQQQWSDQQARMQQLLTTMNDIRGKISTLKEELTNPQLTVEQRQAKAQALQEHMNTFAKYQAVIMNASKNARAQQAAKQQQAQAQGGSQQGQQSQVQQQQAQQQQQQAQAQAQQQQTATPQMNAQGISNSPMPAGNAATPTPTAQGGPAAAAAAAAAAIAPGKASPAPLQQVAGTQSGTNSPGITRPNSTTLNQSSTAAQPSTPLVARPLVPQAVPQGRPSLTNGQVGFPAMTGPALAKPPPTIPFDTSTRLLGKRNLAQLLSTIDASEKLDPDVEDVLLDVADEFIESVVNFSCRLAKHRKSDVLGLEDVKLTLDKEWNIRVMGFADEKIETRRRSTKEGNKDHKAKLTAVSTAKSLQ